MAKGNFMSIEEVNQKLDKGLQDIFQSDRFQEMLKVMSKFRNYSFNNTLMIMLQRPDATMVKGYRQWQELGRNVNSGEKSIKILAPLIKKEEVEKVDPQTKKPKLDNNGQAIKEKKDFLVGFKGVSVFDIGQTNGKEIPSVRDFINRDLQDDNSIGKLYKDFYDHINQDGKYSVREDATEKGVGGYYAPNSDEIVVSNTTNKNDAEKFRVLIHEYAHAKLHNLEGDYKDVPRSHKEAQAEGVAYIVSNYYGLDTSDVSLGYIATWSQDPHLARIALAEVQEVSNEMIDVLDELQKEKINEFYQNNNKEYDQVADFLNRAYEVDLNTVNKENPEIQFEILQKDRGNVLSARLEYSEKVDKFQVRLNNNRIIPLDEFDKEGNYAFLNKELTNAKDYQSINDSFDVVQITDLPISETKNEINESTNVKYLLADHRDYVKLEFNTESEAEHFKNRLEISQALHQQSVLTPEKSDSLVQEKLQDIEKQLNYSVGKYLTHGTDKEFYPTGKGGTAIGWTLMKRPDIQDLNGLQQYVSDTKHLASNKNLRNAMDNATVIESDNVRDRESSRKEEAMELA